MDSELRSVLARCLADMDRGASVEDCLKRNATRANEIRPHLETWRALSGVSVPQTQPAGFDRGRQVIFAALATGSHRTKGISPLRLAPAWATAAAGIVGAVLLLGGAAGTSAALGGPDLSAGVFEAVGVTNGESGIGHSNASERGLACANPNAFEGKLNSEDKSQNAEDATAKEPCGDDECPADAVDCPEGDPADAAGVDGGEGDSDNGIKNAPDAADNGKEHANPNAFEGSGNAEDGKDNANGNGLDNAGNAGGQGNNGEGQGNAGQGQSNGNAAGNQ